MGKLLFFTLLFISVDCLAINLNSAPFSLAVDSTSPKVVIDHQVKPVVNAIRKEGVPARPVARIMAPSGLFFDVVVNEVVIVVKTDVELHAFLARWNARVLSPIATANDSFSAYLVRVDLQQAVTDKTNELMDRLDNKIYGILKVSDQNAKRLITLMAKERLEHHTEIGFSMDMLLTRPDKSLMVFSISTMYPGDHRI